MRSDTRTVGKDEAVRRVRHRPIRVDPDQVRASELGPVSEVPDARAAVRVDDHVVGGPILPLPQIGHLGQLPAVEAEQLLVVHRGDQHAALRPHPSPEG